MQWSRQVEEAIEAGARDAWPQVAAAFKRRYLLPLFATGFPTDFPQQQREECGKQP